MFGGLALLDFDRFWADQETASKDPLAPDCPQVSLRILKSTECFLAELGVEEDWHRLMHNQSATQSRSSQFPGFDSRSIRERWITAGADYGFDITLDKTATDGNSYETAVGIQNSDGIMPNPYVFHCRVTVNP